MFELEIPFSCLMLFTPFWTNYNNHHIYVTSNTILAWALSLQVPPIALSCYNLQGGGFRQNKHLRCFQTFSKKKRCFQTSKLFSFQFSSQIRSYSCWILKKKNIIEWQYCLTKFSCRKKYTLLSMTTRKPSSETLLSANVVSSFKTLPLWISNCCPHG